MIKPARWLGEYQRSAIPKDALAGLTVWALLVPQALAYGQLAPICVHCGTEQVTRASRPRKGRVPASSNATLGPHAERVVSETKTETPAVLVNSSILDATFTASPMAVKSRR